MSLFSSVVLLALLALLAAQVRTQAIFDATINGVPALDDSSALQAFANASQPFELLYNDTTIQIELEATSSIDYQIFLISSGGLQVPSASFSGSLALGAQRSLSFDVNCSLEMTTSISVLFTARGSGTVGPYSVVTAAFLRKECHIPGCPAGCGSVGECDFYLGRCNCPEPYYGPSCEILFETPLVICPTDVVDISWSQPYDLATDTDWLAVLIGVESDLVSDGFASSDTNVFLNWFYVGEPGRRIAANGSISVSVIAPGDYFLTYLTADGYFMLAGRTLTVLSYEDCNLCPVCGEDGVCANRGTCVSNATCECDTGYTGPGCTYGCTGVVEVNNETNLFITDGTPRGVPYARYLDCTWVIRAPEDAKGISLDFSYFQTYEGWDYLKIYASDQVDTSALVSSLSGNGEQNGTFSVSTDKHVMLLQFQSDYFGFRADGFGANINILYPPPLTWLKYKDPASIVFVVLIALSMALITGAGLAIIFRYRKIFMQSTNFLFCIFILVGMLFGLATEFTLIGRTSRPMCIARMWVPSLSFAIIFGSLSAKVFNAYRMFQQISEGKSLKDDHRILLFVGVFLFIESGFLAIWTGVSPPRVVRQEDPNTSDDWLVCDYKQVFWPAASLLLKFLLLVITGVISWRTRLLMANYAESKYVGLTIYNFSLTLLIAVPLIVLLKTYHIAVFLVWSMAILSCCFLSFCLLFGRLLYYMVFPSGKPRGLTNTPQSNDSTHSEGR